MAITYDPDDQPGSELSSRREGIGFTSDRPITEIRAVYKEELVYAAEGGFVAPFTGSTKTGNTFKVIRRGCWNRDFTLYPEEEPEPTTSLWTAIYDVDMAAQPSQTILAPAVPPGGGAQTTCIIDGRTWTARQASLSGLHNASVILTNGTGIALVCNNTSWSGGQLGASAIHLDLASQVPAWNPSLQTAILVHLTAGTMNTLNDGAGIGSCNWNPAGNGSGDIGTHLGAGYYAPSVSGALPSNIMLVSPLLTSAPANMVTQTLDHTIAFVRQSAAQGWAASLPWAGSMPSIEQLTPFAVVRSTGAPPTSASGFAVWCSAGFGHVNTVTIKRIQVLQKA